MFKPLRKRRHAGPAKTLKSEADETVARLASPDGQFGDELMITITSIYTMLGAASGLVSNLSNQQSWTSLLC
ncbi:MAG: hypothetical protein JWM36_1179 [Hyphomicrobiales bacterium]|nr:hypothetical protein [Hyphomicrobiales bacterium]